MADDEGDPCKVYLSANGLRELSKSCIEVAELLDENQGVTFKSTSKYLKSCPFCGGEAVHGIVEDEKSDDFGGHFIQCTNERCGASVGLRFACGDDPRPLLAGQWNTRAPDHMRTVAEKLAEALLLEHIEIFYLAQQADKKHRRITELPPEHSVRIAYSAGSEALKLFEESKQ